MRVVRPRCSIIPLFLVAPRPLPSTRLAGIVVLIAMGGGAVACEQAPTDATMIIALEGEPSTLTVHLSSDLPGVMVAANVFNGLIGYDFDFQPTPDLAERWEQSADGLVYTFHLTDQARWHDGMPVTAADVEYTFNEILPSTHPRSGRWWGNVVSARATGPQTFVFELAEPYAPFLTLLGDTFGSGTLIMPRHVYAGSDARTNPANRHPIGSGPFRFSRWEPGALIELVRNDDYFKLGLPKLDRLVMQIVPDGATRLLAFERGELDFLHAYIVPYAAVPHLRQDPRLEILERGLEGLATNENLLLNLRNPYLGDARVRQAIAYAIDRESIIERALFGLGRVAHSHVNSGVAWAHTPEFDVYRAHDPDRSEALLDAAGFPADPAGRRFTLRLTHDAGKDVETRSAAIVRDNLRDIGIEVVVEAFDRPTYVDRTFRGWDFDLALQNFVSGPDPALGVSSRYHSKQIRKVPFVNAMAYRNAELDELMDAETRILDREQRAARWRRIQEILMQDLPVLPLFEFPVLNAVSSRFGDVVTKPSGYLQSREQAYLR